MSNPMAGHVGAYITNASAEDTEALSRVFTQVVGSMECISPTERIRAVAKFTNGALAEKIKADESNAILIAKAGEQIVGFAFATCEPGHIVRIEWVGMLPAWRRKPLNSPGHTLTDAFLYHLNARAEVIGAKSMEAVFPLANAEAAQFFAQCRFDLAGEECQPSGAIYLRMTRSVGESARRPSLH
jgi:hypothetical protein